MNKFLNSIKDALVRAWHWLAGLVSRIFTRPFTQGLPMSERLRPTVKYIASLAVIAIAIVAAIFLIKGHNKEDDKNPDIAQVYEPSIGTPLPPDEPGNSGTVSGEVAPSPTPTPEAPKTGVDLDDKRTAPKTGIDPNTPIAYKNSDLKFTAILPAHTIVAEEKNSVTFSSQASWYYTVTTSAQGSETLQTIKAELANSSGIKNLTVIKFNGIDALQFTSSEINGQGIVFIKDNTVYYLLGNQNYFKSFQLISSI